MSGPSLQLQISPPFQPSASSSSSSSISSPIDNVIDQIFENLRNSGELSKPIDHQGSICYVFFARSIDSYICEEKLGIFLKTHYESVSPLDEVKDYEQNLEIITVISNKILSTRQNFAGDPLKTQIQAVFNDFTFPLRIENDELSNSQKEYLKYLAEAAFKQHLVDPLQFVSHGFHHSLKVTEYIKNIINVLASKTTNPKILSMRDNPCLNFLMQNIGIWHDTGYSELGHLSKPSHGPIGAKIFNRVNHAFGDLLKEQQLDHEHLLDECQNAIFYHSADKNETHFDIKISSQQGEFLCQSNLSNDEIRKILDYFTIRNNQGRPIISNGSNKIEIQLAVQGLEPSEKQSLFGKIQEIVQSALLSWEINLVEKSQIPAKCTKVTPLGKECTGLHGRVVDLISSKDRLVGLEYSKLDLEDSPFQIIRLADNMDMTRERFSPKQNCGVFKSIYFSLGSSDPAIIEVIQPRSSTSTRKRVRESEPSKSLKRSRPNDTVLSSSSQSPATGINTDSKLVDSPPHITEIDTTKKIEEPTKEEKIRFFEKFGLELDPDSDEIHFVELKAAASKMNNVTIRHFGGCEAVEKVDFKVIENRASVEVKVNSVKFTTLNKINFVENDTQLGVGEYQIWRAEEAYKSILFNRMPIEVDVKDEHGREPLLHYRPKLSEKDVERKYSNLNYTTV
jgi:hypothetical protein